MSALVIVLICFAVVLTLVLAIMFTLVPMTVYLRCLFSGAHLSMNTLIGMKMRGVDYKNIVRAYMVAKKAGLDVSILAFEKHKSAGGDVHAVAEALVFASEMSLDISAQEIMKLDLAGKDIVLSLRACVNPKLFQTEWITAICEDGMEVSVRVKLTIKTEVKNISKGLGVESLLSRVNEAIVSCIGQESSHKNLLKNPEIISRWLFDHEVDAETGFEIVAIDVTDVTVGANIGAKMLRDEAEKKKIISQAEAEERRATALALEQEMKARTQEMKSLVLSAEAEVPKAIANAIKEGKMDVLDYYKVQNLQADTEMRKALFEMPDKKEEKPKKKRFSFDDFDDFRGDV